MKKNFHRARKFKLGKIINAINNYPRTYATPKYLEFCRIMAENGWSVRIYTARVSKYVFVTSKTATYKIRFSNHKPIYQKELENDCDYYVGISHTNVVKTEELLKILLGKTYEMDKSKKQQVPAVQQGLHEGSSKGHGTTYVDTPVRF